MERKEITRQTCALESAARVSGRQPHLLLWSPYFNVCTPQVFAFSEFSFKSLSFYVAGFSTSLFTFCSCAPCRS